MHYFIDGYNLLFFYITMDGSLQKKREELIKLLDDKLDLLSARATIVFDNFTNEEEASQKCSFNVIDVIFTNRGQTADDYIVSEYKKPSVVVTADKSLAAKCRALGARIKSPETFLRWVTKKRNREVENNYEETKENIEKLLEIFEKRLQEQNLED